MVIWPCLPCYGWSSFTAVEEESLCRACLFRPIGLSIVRVSLLHTLQEVHAVPDGMNPSFTVSMHLFKCVWLFSEHLLQTLFAQ